MTIRLYLDEDTSDADLLEALRTGGRMSCHRTLFRR